MNLTNENDSVLNLQNFYNKENISLKITREELKGVCESFLSDIKKILDKLFQDAKEKKKSDSYNKSKTTIYNINSGILLLNLGKMREINVEKTIDK